MLRSSTRRRDVFGEKVLDYNALRPGVMRFRRKLVLAAGGSARRRRIMSTSARSASRRTAASRRLRLGRFFMGSLQDLKYGAIARTPRGTLALDDIGE